MNAVDWQVSVDETMVVERLLAEGLDLYGQNRAADAVRCWQRVLAMVPGEPRALEYLECAGAPATSAEPSQTQVMSPALRARAAFDPGERAERQALEALLRQRRFEEAFELLYRARDPGALLGNASWPPPSEAIAPPPSGPRPVAPAEPPAIEAPPDAMESLFARATEAYLSGDLPEAERLYEACLSLRPEDWRVQNNLKKLRARSSP